MSDDGFTKHGGGRHEGPARTSPYPLSRLSAPHELVDVAREIQQADALLGAVTGGKLAQIARQIRSLQEQARQVLEAAQRDSELHRAACNFKKRPGHVYHLYRRGDGVRYLSMLSPEEWGGAPPHAFEGSYRLELDMSWTPADEADAHDAEAGALAKLLGPGG
ncbi:MULTISPECIES: DUF2452 domain-containing protein [Sorangium]|uniref:DUF2452 domain-containing protein n=2 Tax=Sorangium cellulosum TaxID=56 RepID=A0A150TUT7_SORCE|nr:DUF2452 domain-containing protein [Sorangium cellulosum]AGP42233.1 hypothetical protein SCE1572_51685 [Sorangium cellulosum So0157-2]KYF84860.1 hypothetical protein BE18_16385 [Sorangium cellulosum]KYF92710.1 hypothetical protein BE20_01565 [Sorangium cellulosum]KYG08406.1 hypothetical protein BE21_23900 [Sorangium cellulosum]